jgi:hypothetical protein
MPIDNLDSLTDEELNRQYATKVEGELLHLFQDTKEWRMFSPKEGWVTIPNYCSQVGREKVLSLLRGT